LTTNNTKYVNSKNDLNTELAANETLMAGYKSTLWTKLDDNMTALTSLKNNTDTKLAANLTAINGHKTANNNNLLLNQAKIATIHSALAGKIDTARTEMTTAKTTLDTLKHKVVFAVVISVRAVSILPANAE
jgi:alpha-L-fucosidase